VSVWLSVNDVAHVTLRWPGLLLRWVTVCRYTILVFYQPPRPTQPGHPSVGRRSEYWQWLRPSVWKKLYASYV